MIATLEGKRGSRSPEAVALSPFDKGKWYKETRKKIRPILEDTTDAAATKTLKTMKTGIAFDVYNPQVSQFIEGRTQRFAQRVTDTTWNQLQTQISQDLKDGKSITQISETVNGVMTDRTASQAMTIARTEAMGAYNGGKLEGWEQSGVVGGKKWLTGLDDRTRKTHIAAHGQTVGLKDDFVVGAGRGKAPGQLGVAKEDINCRCTMTAVLGDDAEEFIQAMQGGDPAVKWQAIKDKGVKKFNADIFYDEMFDPNKEGWPAGFYAQELKDASSAKPVMIDVTKIKIISSKERIEVAKVEQYLADPKKGRTVLIKSNGDYYAIENHESLIAARTKGDDLVSVRVHDLDAKAAGSQLPTPAAPKVAAPPTPTPAPPPITPPPPAAPVIAPPAITKLPPPGFPADPADLTKIKSLGGSTGAELVEDLSGNKFVMKAGANEGHLRSESLADKLYEALGVKVPEHHLYEGPPPVKISKFLDNTTPLGQLTGSARNTAEANLRVDFVADALLGNWDVVGMNADNILVDNWGAVFRVDNGGALRYRAQGALKDAKDWTDEVLELDTMRKKGSASKIFGKLTDDHIAKQIDKVIDKKAAVLDLIDDPALKKRIEKRMDYLEDWKAKHLAKSAPTPPPVNVVPTAPKIPYNWSNPTDHVKTKEFLENNGLKTGGWAVDHDEVTNSVGAAVHRVLKSNADLTDLKISFIHDPKMKAFAVYDELADEIRINTYRRVWQGEKYVKREIKDAPGWMVAETREDIITHELGHALHARELKNSPLTQIANWNDEFNKPFKTQKSLDEAARVSKYATVSRREFVAEVFTGLRKGKKYDDDVMKLYIKMEGPGHKNYQIVNGVVVDMTPDPLANLAINFTRTPIHPQAPVVKTPLPALKPKDAAMFQGTDLVDHKTRAAIIQKATNSAGVESRLANDNRKVWKNLTDREKEAIRDYTGGDYRLINKRARRGIDSANFGRTADDYIESLDTAFARAEVSLHDDIVYYRGTEFNSGLPPEYQNLRPGQLLTDWGFGSFTTEYLVSSVFTGSTNPVRFKVVAPKGSRVLPVRVVSHNPGEDETIFPRGATLLVHDVRKNGNILEVTAELLES